jgi:hypothetical protein
VTASGDDNNNDSLHEKGFGGEGKPKKYFDLMFGTLHFLIKVCTTYAHEFTMRRIMFARQDDMPTSQTGNTS